MARPTKEEAELIRRAREEYRDYLENLRRQVRALRTTGLKDRAVPSAETHSAPCGAKTRSGGSCLHKAIPGKTRCRFHGGKSTGPKTATGKGLIAAAQRKRWALWRGQKQSGEQLIDE